MIDGDAPTDLLLVWARKSGGWLLFLALAAVVVVLLTRGFQLAHRQKGLLAKQVMLAALLPLTLRFALYVLFNLGFTMGASAMALPLLMYGKTDLCVTMLLLGLMLSAVRTGSLYARYSGAPRRPETPSGG